MIVLNKETTNVVLTIDPGSKLGYSVWEDGEVICYGEQTVAASDKATTYSRYVQMQENIRRMFYDYKPSTLVIEQVAAYGGSSTLNAKLWLLGTFFESVCEAERAGCKVVAVPIMSLKAGVAGSGKAKKVDMVHAVNKQMGTRLALKDHNTADAIGLGIYYYATRG